MKDKGKKYQPIRVGAPEKDEELKKAPNGLTNAQWERFKVLARSKNISGAMLLSQVAQWYLDAVDRNAGTTDAHAMFDKTLEGAGEAGK